MKIFAFHLLNDYSGSPKVLRQLTTGWSRQGVDVTVITGSESQGFLNEIQHVTTDHFWYRFAQNRLARLCFLIYSQLALIAKFWNKVQPHDIVYVNTVLPFGAPILGWLKGTRVIYHIHESTVKPALLRWILFGLARRVGDNIIFVSRQLKESVALRHPRECVCYNAIEERFFAVASRHHQRHTKLNQVLMVCSLKWYKGVREFLALAQRHPDLEFRLVVNAGQDEIDAFFIRDRIPHNLDIRPTQTDMHPHYRWADLVVNLSRPDGWVESFGLTIIEGMAYGLPAIVPPVGGIAEVVRNGLEGYHVDSRDADQLSMRLKEILGSHKEYQSLRENALERIQVFRENALIDHTLEIILDSKNKFGKLFNHFPSQQNHKSINPTMGNSRNCSIQSDTI